MIELKADALDLVSGGIEMVLAGAAIGLCVMECYKRCAGTLILEPYIQDTMVETRIDLYDPYGFWIGYDIDTYTVSEQKYNRVYIF